MKQLLALLFLILSGLGSLAQNIDMGSKSDSDSIEHFKFMPLPYINYDRSLEFQIGALPMAMYTLNKKDTVSPQSVSGLIGIWTTNKSWFTIAFSKFYLKEDKWRITAAGGFVSVNFQTYVDLPIGGFINYNTAADFILLQLQRRVIGKWFVGFHYDYLKFNTRFAGLDKPKYSYLNGLGVIISRDGRDNVYYPKSGGESELDWTNYPSFINEKGGINKGELSHNHFFSLRENKDIIAVRAYAGFGLGDLAFEQQFIVGQTDIRGYTQGKYRGEQLYSIQGEYRWNFAEKFGLVGFFGLATIGGSLNDDYNGLLLPGVGGGFRYTAFEKNHFNVGLDAAVGKDDWGLYFRIGEAF